MEEEKKIEGGTTPKFVEDENGGHYEYVEDEFVGSTDDEPVEEPTPTQEPASKHIRLSVIIP